MGLNVPWVLYIHGTNRLIPLGEWHLQVVLECIIQMWRSYMISYLIRLKYMSMEDLIESSVLQVLQPGDRKPMF